MSALLDVAGVSAGYDGVEIVHEVSLHVEAGELVTIIGPNGAGKSTLLKAIFGLLPITRGAVLFQGREVTGYSPPRMVAAGASFVPQTDNIFPSLTVQENLEMGGYRRVDDVTARVREVLALFPDLAERPRERALRLSGGQRQTLAIARALMLDPLLLLLDEPSASLSPIMRAGIFQRICAIRDQGVAIVLVEQSAKEALAHSSRGYVMVAGRNALEQSGAELLANPEVGRLFLGLEDDAAAGEAASPLEEGGAPRTSLN